MTALTDIKKSTSHHKGLLNKLSKGFLTSCCKTSKVWQQSMSAYSWFYFYRKGADWVQKKLYNTYFGYSNQLGPRVYDQQSNS